MASRFLGVIYDPLRVSAVATADMAVIGMGHTSRISLDIFLTQTSGLLASGVAFRQLGAGGRVLASNGALHPVLTDILHGVPD